MENPVIIEEQQPENIIEEGKAKIILDKNNIFYNPVQEFNRDLSIAIISQYNKELEQGKKYDSDLTILEALSATGLRSIRYAKEIPGISKIIANDISMKAVDTIKKNVIYNDVENIVIPNQDDATMVMYKRRKEKFDVIDLDPYGSPTIFLDAAVQSLKDNGLLMVTATDMAVLAGSSPETCYVKYGAVSMKFKACHEMALRILLQNIASHAARYGRVITPLLSISADFYIRVFVKIRTSLAACKQNTSNLGFVYQCTGCECFSIQPLGCMNSKNMHKFPRVPVVDKVCVFCKHNHRMGGPIWIGSLHDKVFINNIISNIENEEYKNLQKLNTIKRIQGILHVVKEELEVPLYYQVNRLMSIIKCHVPPMVLFRSALLNAGYKVSYSHACKTSVKTDAPNQVIWDIVRAWEKLNPVKREKFDVCSAGLAILNSEIITNISFKKHPDAIPFSIQKHLMRFQMNPSSHWGPGTKSTAMIKNEHILKKKMNQNKKKRKNDIINEKLNAEKKRNILEEGVSVEN
ncbi:PREDICTED: probable tRNA (guanine(26)-N(2))-dimethyltransferase [Ceratosolen solmsi marchali]|uniref:tRNA (guanine(26)-N(2))-dimethyltransferase n=1 Tax=Ceratosolen solmsi marchali TaxID=326594 RepID=A0AAJ6YGZ3_9HYME|nr:PREDICTED: probable tRNA (guanine(26)-N(2))-dimethyltransferase [Ceratosolen solmsi marchali]